MIGLVLSAIVLSAIGALAQRGAAALLGVRARVVVGTGPRIGDEGRVLGPVELRPIPVWIWTAIADAGAPVGRAAAALAVGPIAMLLVPLAVLVVAVMVRGTEEPDPGPPLVVGTVEEGSPADDAGIVAGDVIREVDGRDTPNLAALVAAVRDRGGERTRVTIEREGRTRELEVVPLALEDRAILGVRARAERRAVGLGEAITLSLGAVSGLYRAIFAPGAVHEADAPLSAPVGMVRARDEMDAATRVALVAMAWTAVAPLWALLMTIGGAIAINRRGA